MSRQVVFLDLCYVDEYWLTTWFCVVSPCGQSVKAVYSSDQSSGTDHWFVLMQRSNEEMRTHLQNRIDYVKNVIGPRIGLPFIQPPVGQRSNRSGVKLSGDLEEPSRASEMYKYTWQSMAGVFIMWSLNYWLNWIELNWIEIECTYLTCDSRTVTSCHCWLLSLHRLNDNLTVNPFQLD